MLTNTQRSPLAAAQTSMWYYEKLYPGTPAYHYTIVFDLENPKVDQLRTAIEALALRHEALQCRVVEMRGQAYLEPLSAATSTSSSWPLQIFELRTESPPPVEDLMETLESIQAAAFITKGFLFDQEPLWRCALLAFSENKYQFVMVAHHIIVDVTSMNILMRDLSEIYNALLENRPPSLTALPSLYQLKLASCNHEAKLALWKERLSGLTPLVIKTDFMPQSDFRYHSDRFNFKISRDQVQALSALAEAQQVSLHRLFLASLYILLHRYTGCTDICIGTTSANRRNYSEKVEEVVSSFINSIPLRVSIEGKLRFDEFLEKLSLICIEAYEN
ncbi:MAG TPA: condensation domain-containing protein, partial [Gammaproteobacteria bacterium]|nr:condensation domain-containing protein [Gammaproteobacteria bacterium]